MMFWSKIFKIKDHFLVAICDEELLDKTISVDNFKIRVSKMFYGGKLIDEKEALILMEKSTIGNLFGKKVVHLAIEHNFIAEENVMYINGIPHAQFIQ